MKIGNIKIDKGKCKIVAELGTLHNQSFTAVKKAIQSSFDAGADLCKMQMIHPELVWWATKAQKARYAGLKHQILDWAMFLEECNEEFKSPVFLSVFHEWHVECLDDFMPAWKLGYKARLMPALIEACIQTKKPLIMSLNKALELDDFFDIAMTYPGVLDRIIFLYVQSIYPIPKLKVRLPKFGRSSETTFQGLSIHSKDFDIFRAAFCLNAQMLEVHVKDRGASGPDVSFALTMNELEKLVKIRNEYS